MLPDRPPGFNQTGFGPMDIVLFCVYMITFVIIGVYYGLKGVRKSNTVSESSRAREFLTGMNTHHIFPAVLSMFTYYISSLSLLSAPSTIYHRGTQYMIIVFTFPIAVLLANLFVVPVFYNLKIKTSLEYLELRFDFKLRTIGCVIYSVNSLLRMAMWLYTPSLVLFLLSGLPFVACVIIGGIVFTFYTSIGGMRAIVLADLIQCSVIILSTLSVVVKATVLLGGFAEVYGIAKENEHVQFDDFDPNPFTYKVTFWTVVLGHTCYYTQKYCIDQSVIQRYMPAKSLQQARKVLYMQIPLMSTFFFIICFNGLALYAYYHNCDPFLTQRIKRVEHLFPLFVSDAVGYIDGLKGFFVAGIFSGSLSSMSSSLNSLSTLAFEDIVKRHFQAVYGEKDVRIFVRVIAIAYGVLCMALVFVAMISKNTLRARNTINTMLGSPLFGIFILGLFNPRSTAKGALIALYSGILFGLFLFGSHHYFYPGILPAHVGVSECTEYYCRIAGPFEDGCELGGNRSNVNPHKWKPKPTSAPINWKMDFLLRSSYHMAGLLCVVFTILVGSIASLFTKPKKDRKEIEKCLVMFFKRDGDKKDEKEDAAKME